METTTEQDALLASLTSLESFERLQAGGTSGLFTHFLDARSWELMDRAFELSLSSSSSNNNKNYSSSGKDDEQRLLDFALLSSTVVRPRESLLAVRIHTHVYLCACVSFFLSFFLSPSPPSLLPFHPHHYCRCKRNWL